MSGSKPCAVMTGDRQRLETARSTRGNRITLVCPSQTSCLWCVPTRKSSASQTVPCVATFLNRDEHSKMLDCEAFSSQDDLANIHIGSRMPTPVLEAPEPTASSRPTVAPEVTMNAPSHHPMAAANQTPGYKLSTASSQTSPMQLGLPAVSPRRTLAHGTTAKEMLLWESTLPFPGTLNRLANVQGVSKSCKQLEYLHCQPTTRTEASTGSQPCSGSHHRGSHQIHVGIHYAPH